MTKHTEEELDNLTDEERAGLLEGEDTEEVEPEVDTTHDANTPEAAPQPEPDAAPTRETEPEPAPESQPVNVYTGPYLNAATPDDAQAKLDNITTRKDDLSVKFDEGDIDVREYQRQLDALNREERGIEQEVFKAQISTEMRQGTWVNQHVAGFLLEHTEYKANPALFGALDLEVRKLQAESNDPFDPAILQAAHKNLRDNALALLGVTDDKPATQAKAAKQERIVPPTLGRLPAAELESTSDGRFAALDRLAETDPLKYQDALAKLSDAEMDAYQRSTE